MLDCIYKLLFSFVVFFVKESSSIKNLIGENITRFIFQFILFSLVIEFSIFQQQFSQQFEITIKKLNQKNILSKNIWNIF
jgi:hypothetical protein